MFQRSKAIAFSLTLLLLISTTTAVNALTAPLAGGTIEEIDRQILSKEAELFSINTNFRTEYRQHEKWEQRRIGASNIAAGGMANAGDITLIAQWWKYAKRPGAGLDRRGRLQSGCNVVLIAYSYLAAMHLLDMGHDLLRVYRNKAKGLDAGTLCRKVSSTGQEIDTLLQSRAALLSNGDYSQSQKEILSAESTVMGDIRDLCLSEFEKLFVAQYKGSAYRYIRCAGTAAACVMGGFDGALPVIVGLKKTNLKVAGSGGIGFIISAGILTAAPVLMHAGSSITGKIAQKRVAHSLGNRRYQAEEQLKSDLAQLERLASVGQGSIKAKMNFFSLAENSIFARAEQLRSEAKFEKRRFGEDVLWYSLMGGPQIAWGTMVARAGYRYNKQPIKAFTEVAAAATVNENAWAAWLIHSIQETTRSEIRYGKNDAFKTGASEKLKSISSSALEGGQTN